MNILRAGLASGAVEVAALCDVDESQLGAASDEIERLTGSTPKGFADYRELLSSERPEIVIVATPDHWHALTAIAAIKAGAHVYLEKPISHTMDEGKAILAAARAHERVVQVGHAPSRIAAQHVGNVFPQGGQ